MMGGNCASSAASPRDVPVTTAMRLPVVRYAALDPDTWPSGRR